MMDRLFSTLRAEALASGDGHAGISFKISAIDSAELEATKTEVVTFAAGDVEAKTGITSTSSVESGDGSVTSVEANTDSQATGDGSVAYGGAVTLAAGTGTLDIAVGLAEAGASGETVETVEASVAPEGDETEVFKFDSELEFDVVEGQLGVAVTSFAEAGTVLLADDVFLIFH